MTNPNHRVDVLQTVVLPPPVHEDDAGIFRAFDMRRTIRDISSASLSPQLLSDLLWAACGVNRPVGPFGSLGRTAASASNSQEIDLYLATPEAVYLYDARLHRLIPVVRGDFRAKALTPEQKDISPGAPVQLIYVADIHRLTHTTGFNEPGLHDPEVQKSYYFVDTGLIAENVYLFAAAHGLAAWFHNCDREALRHALSPGPEHRVLFAQSVGYPAVI